MAGCGLRPCQAGLEKGPILSMEGGTEGEESGGSEATSHETRAADKEGEHGEQSGGDCKEKERAPMGALGDQAL
jgi:hypothetical protein